MAIMVTIYNSLGIVPRIRYFILLFFTRYLLSLSSIWRIVLLADIQFYFAIAVATINYTYLVLITKNVEYI